MKIGILGTRGIPNHYGGFEQLAEKLSVALVQEGHSVVVYNSHKHPFKEKEWNGVAINHCYDAEHWMGTAGQFIYDLNCIRNAKKNAFDVILFLGYTSNSVWRKWFPKNAVIISNMDGLEWKRNKYSNPVQRFLKYAEKLAVKHSDYLIADSTVIQKYLSEKYKVVSRYIPYGADIVPVLATEYLAAYTITARNYFMLMARMEPENNIEMILEGFHNSNSDKRFIVVGNTDNRFGRSMLKRFGNDKRMQFVGAIYESTVVHALRSSCSMYFHGHSVGGTNPSLLEAMADKAPIAAHDNEFNRAVLNEDGYYFNSAADVQQLVESKYFDQSMIDNNLSKINSVYNWNVVGRQYDEFIRLCYKEKNIAKTI